MAPRPHTDAGGRVKIKPIHKIAHLTYFGAVVMECSPNRYTPKENVKLTHYWDCVTCKNCLKKKPE